MVGEIPLVSYNCVGGSPAGNPTYPKLNSGITVKRGSSPLYGYNIMAVAPWEGGHMGRRLRGGGRHGRWYLCAFCVL